MGVGQPLQEEKIIKALKDIKVRSGNNISARKALQDPNEIRKQYKEKHRKDKTNKQTPSGLQDLGGGDELLPSHVTKGMK